MKTIRTTKVFTNKDKADLILSIFMIILGVVIFMSVNRQLG